MPESIRIEIYSRPGCHLCDEAKAVIEPFSAALSPAAHRHKRRQRPGAPGRLRHGNPRRPDQWNRSVPASRGCRSARKETQGTVEPVDILTIAAHPDDVELTCAGTLLRMIHQGYSAGILDLTQGEMGTRGTPELRAKEAEAAAAVIGARWRERMNLGDSRLTASIENRMAVAERIRAAKPRTVILPYWEGRHPDHYTAATLGYEACYAAGLKQLPHCGRSAPPEEDPLLGDVFRCAAFLHRRHHAVLSQRSSRRCSASLRSSPETCARSPSFIPPGDASSIASRRNASTLDT